MSRPAELGVWAWGAGLLLLAVGCAEGATSADARGNGVDAPPLMNCGNGTCESGQGETCTTCALDCLCREVVISASTQNVDMAALFQNPSAADSFRVVINPGVVVGSSSVDVPALETGAFPSGSEVTLENHGRIQGHGGAGGRGAADSIYDASPGQDGGPALVVTVPLIVDNAGAIWGGGGGGGGSGAYHNGDGTTAGSGGGGGAGSGAGTGAAAGSGTNYDYTGAQGQDGSAQSGGAGGTTSPWNHVGGRGGGPGAAGDDGSAGTTAYLNTPCCGTNTSGAMGGSAGAAVVGNAQVTWTATGERLGPVID